MYNTILVPLDTSKRAEAILPHVEELALKYKAKVIFVKVMDAPAVTIAYSRQTFEQHRKDLEDLEKRDGQYLADLQLVFQKKGIDVETLLTQGTVVETIITTAERENADLIAVASHGRGGMSRQFYGSVSAALLQRIDRPLLLVRSRKI